MASKQTTNLKLPIWEATDRLTMADFNAAMTILDSAYANCVTQLWHAGTTPPANTKIFWIDTTPTTGGLKAYINGAWKAVATQFT